MRRSLVREPGVETGSTFWKATMLPLVIIDDVDNDVAILVIQL